MGLEKSDTHRQKNGSLSLHCTKINSKLIKDLNVKSKLIKLFGEKKREKILGPSVRQRVLRLDTKCMIHKSQN